MVISNTVPLANQSGNFVQEANNNSGVSVLAGVKPDTSIAGLLRASLSEDMREVLSGGALKIDADDDQMRPLLVGAQGDAESAVSQLSHDTVILHVTHTDLPSSPLCKLLPSSIDPAIKENAASVATLSKRVISMDRLAQHPEADVRAVYSENGLSQRTLEEQQAFTTNLQKHTHLKAHELKGKLDDIAPSGAILIAYEKQNPENNAVMMIDASQISKASNQWGFSLSRIQDMNTTGSEMLQARLPLLKEIQVNLNPVLSIK